MCTTDHVGIVHVRNRNYDDTSLLMNFHMRHGREFTDEQKKVNGGIMCSLACAQRKVI